MHVGAIVRLSPTVYRRDVEFGIVLRKLPNQSWYVLAQDGSRAELRPEYIVEAEDAPPELFAELKQKLIAQALGLQDDGKAIQMRSQNGTIFDVRIDDKGRIVTNITRHQPTGDEP